MPRRVISVFAGLCAVAGICLLIVSVVATRRLWFNGYVSEAGIGAQPGAYRGGLLLAALALVLLAVVLTRQTLIGAGLLAVGGLGAALSSAVTCSAGCPLPPYETPTAADLVHAGASILSVGAVALAMIAIAVFGEEPRLRRAARVGAWIVIPLVVGVGFGLLAIGKGQFTGVIERAVLVSVSLWTVVMCLLCARRSANGHEVDRLHDHGERAREGWTN